MKYEEAVARIREICERLKDRNTTLEETAELYKEGLKLTEECRKLLDSIDISEGEANE